MPQTERGMTRLRCVVEYDGTEYAGFQLQPGQPHVRTIQGALEEAIRVAQGHPARVVAAGRTDAGVHARGQVVHFDTDREWPPKVWQRALNARLPRDVVIREALPAPGEFHARFSARSRTYQYTIYNGPVRSPLLARRSWHVPARLDAARMNLAAAGCCGQHDFGVFASQETATSTVRRVRAFSCQRSEEMVTIEIVGDAFLRHMVRRLVGSLVRVGLGKLAPEAMLALLTTGRRELAGPTVPATGLCLAKVEYA